MANTRLPSSFDGNEEFQEESGWQRISRRIREEPLVPIGFALTCAALFGATRSIRAGDHNRTQRMFRARLYAQSFTLLAMVVGSMYWDADRKRRKEFEGLLGEKKAKEKQQAWIKELEARDEEDKEIKAAREARRKAVAQNVNTKEAKVKTAAVVRKEEPRKEEPSKEEPGKEEPKKSVLESIGNVFSRGQK